MDKDFMYRFQVKAPTKMGESIAILGSIPELGMWDLSQCIHLSTSGNLYPKWWVDIAIPWAELPEKIEYKYLRFRADGGIDWESLGEENRWIPQEPQAKTTTIIVDDGDYGNLQPYPYGYGETPLLKQPPLKGENGLKILVIGSSVAMGCSAWLLKGWAELLQEYLHKKYTHQLVNFSQLGANVTTTLKRFTEVVTREKPDMVIISLSLGNEGFAYCKPHEKKALQQRFESGLQELVKITKTLGAIPILGSVYPHNGYTQDHYSLLRETHEKMLSWDVPVLDWLDVLDNGEGRWQSGIFFDEAHPNSEGHRRMFSAMDTTIFALTAKDLAKKKPLFPPKLPINLFSTNLGFKISFNPDNKSLCIVNKSKYEYSITPSWLELQANLQYQKVLHPGIYLAKSRRVETFSFAVGKNHGIETVVKIPPSTDAEYVPLADFFSPSVSDILYYDGNLAILKLAENMVYVVNESEHFYNVQPMWKDVRQALKSLNQGVYVDVYNPNGAFRTMMIGEDGLESRLKIPPYSALPFEYQCALSAISRVAILPLGDRCAARMLLHKMEYDGPAYPFDLTRTTNLSDVADMIENGFEDMWNPDYLDYNDSQGRIFHKKWTGLSFAHEVENTDDPLVDMSPVYERMYKRYSARSQRFWYTIAHCDEVLFIRTGEATRGQVLDLMGKLGKRCEGKPFRLLILSHQSKEEFLDIPNVIHQDLYFNPDLMYDNLQYWLECTEIMRTILDSLGVTSKNLFWCPPNTI